MSRLETQGVIVDLDSGARVTFEFNPEVFQDDKVTEFALIGIPGMSHPRVQFGGGGERSLSFSISLHSGRDKAVPAAINQLQAWMYGDYSGNRLTRAPHKLMLSFGDTWSSEKWVLRSCSVTRRRFDKNLGCIYAEVALDLLQIVETSVSYGEVSGG